MSPRFSPRLRRATVRQFHQCPVCDTVATRSTCECRICGWSGQFIDLHEEVEVALIKLAGQCPELDELLPYSWPKSQWLRRLKAWFQRRGKFDIRA